jgi:hypothetical protein
MIKLKIKNKKGFALLFSVLISGLLVTIGVSIFNISIKEIMISASIRDSQTAYYAADSATECFLYWNYMTEKFNYCESGALGCNDDIVSFNCNGIEKTLNIYRVSGNKNKFSSDNFFDYSSVEGNFEPTADIAVEKSFSVVDGKITIVADFYGYNTSQSGRRVERYYQRTI